MSKNFNLDLSRIPKELILLLEFLKIDDCNSLLLNNDRLIKNIDWNKFLDLAQHHRVYSVIYPKLKVMNESIVPTYVIQTLKHQFQKNTFQMLHLSAEMEKVSRLFSVNDIRVLFLKGPVLATELYGDISLRTSSDLDILIPIKDLDRAEQVLIEEGFEKDEYIKTVLNDWKWRHHHITYFHPKKRIKLEVHWRLNPGPRKEPSFNDLWKRKRKSSITKFPIYILGSEDLFLFLISHGARHGWSRLRWLLDIHQIMTKPINWEHISILLKRYQCFHIGGQAILLSSHLLNTPVIKENEQYISSNLVRNLAQDTIYYLENMINLHTDPVPEDVSKYHERHLFSLMSFEQKVLFTLSFLYPYPEDAELLPLPKYLHLLYFPLRPFLWVWRKTRKLVSIGGFNK
ncbi:nucleotidyltransferase family protein [Bacillus sp. AFS055030]|uniref:nucleotidyltransferase domain-containing protein n=1 Tax=Bacillus sp. AFS055030 TaxID=2033507 RepID=UPI000BFD28D2|nr:nucleotidyltransferase family protein [Bacillus sp. AFS055030]PGL70359.1 Renal dipeptidase [Bacillus sp. AFS055030]